MGYFEGFAGALFKEKEDGLIIFYPHGIIGSGYIVSSEQATKLKRFIRRYYGISLPLVLAAAIIVNIVALLLLILILPIYYIRIKQLLANTRKADEKLKFSESWKHQSEEMGIRSCGLMFTLSLIMTVAAIFAVLISDFSPMAIIGLVIFGLATWQFGRMYHYVDKKKK
jgi:hypothetical protein